MASKASISKAEIAKRLFPKLCVAQGLPVPEAEFKFLDNRKFKFDFAWPTGAPYNHGGVALEVEGGVWTGGRHTSGSGFLKDMEKYNLAALNGWYVLRCTPSTLNSPKTFDLIKEALGA